MQLLALLVLIAAFAVAARWLRVPFPIVFVIGGALLALVPGLPAISPQPDVVFTLFLPPLLFGGGFTIEWRDFKRYVAPIISLAVGLVVFTTVIVALVAHAVIGLPFPVAFVLGAILSPPDAVATEAIGKALPLPRAMKAILGGESLINDAMALVIYRFAIAAVATGTFSLWQAGWQFVYVSVVGIAIGWLGAGLLARLLIALRRADLADETVSVIFSLITPFVVDLAAERVGASGILAAVTAGVITSQSIGKIFDHDARIAAYGVWSVMTFSLNAVLFLLIGLQLRAVFAGLSAYSPLTLAGYGALISAAVIVTRFAWVYPITLVRAKFAPRSASLDPTFPSPRGLFIVSWAGMRGIVTLATALAIPAALADGSAFPNRDLLLFLAFAVIVVTLVGQGLTLPWLIRRLPVDTAEPTGSAALGFARSQAARAGLAALASLESTFTTPTHWEVAGRLRDTYELSIGTARQAAGETDLEPQEITRRLRLAMLGAERAALAGLRRSGEIGDEVYRDLLWELDLVQSRYSG